MVASVFELIRMLLPCRVDFGAQKGSNSPIVDHAQSLFQPPNSSGFAAMRFLMFAFPFIVYASSHASILLLFFCIRIAICHIRADKIACAYLPWHLALQCMMTTCAQ